MKDMVSRTLKIILVVTVIVIIIAVSVMLAFMTSSVSTIRSTLTTNTAKTSTTELAGPGKGTILKYNVSGAFIEKGSMIIKIVDENETHYKVYCKAYVKTGLGPVTYENETWLRKKVWGLDVILLQSGEGVGKRRLKQNTTEEITVMGRTIKAWKTVWSYGYEGKGDLIIYTDRNCIPLLIIEKPIIGERKVESGRIVLVESNTKISPVK